MLPLYEGFIHVCLTLTKFGKLKVKKVCSATCIEIAFFQV